MKRGLFFGIIGFIITFIGVFFYIGSVSTGEEVVELTLEESINGWASLAEILAYKLEEPVSLNDEIFVSILLDEFIEDISNTKRITITRNDYTILWDTRGGRIGREYNGWRINADEGEFLSTDSVSIVGTPIKIEGEDVGFLYIKFENNPPQKTVFLSGWKNYSSILSYSIREEINSKDIPKISNIIKRTSKKDDILQFTILSLDKTIIWDIDNSLIRKDYIEGWIDEARDDEGKSYIYSAVDFQGKKTGEIHLLVSSLSERKVVSQKAILGELFKIKNLLFPIVAFVLFFFVGLISTKLPTRVGMRATRRYTEEELEEIEKDAERLKIQRTMLISEIAEKQKVKKELQKEIESVEESKEFLPKEMAEGTVTTEEEEERILFENLFNKGEEKALDKGKEEQELAQRIGSKRREEIGLSARVEAKRKELIDLQRQIDEAMRKLEKYE